MSAAESSRERIGQIARLLAHIVASSDEQQRAADYYEASSLIDELVGSTTLGPVFGDESTARVRLMDLRRHLSCVAGLSKPDYFSVEEHHLKALGVIVGLELQWRQTRSATQDGVKSSDAPSQAETTTISALWRRVRDD